MDKLPSIDSLSTFIHHKKPHKFCFVGFKCQKCRDLRAFLGVKSGLLILVRVKDLTFCNSVLPQVANAVVPDDQHIVVVEIVAVDEETKNSFGFRVLVALAGIGFLSFF